MQYFGHIIIYACSSTGEIKKSVRETAQGWSKLVQSFSFQWALFKILMSEKNINK